MGDSANSGKTIGGAGLKSTAELIYVYNIFLCWLYRALFKIHKCSFVFIQNVYNIDMILTIL